MRSIVMTVLCLVIGTSLVVHVVEGQAPAPPQKARRWFKGNTHAHTANTDGDSSPIDVVRFYRDNGYHFLVLSDHDSLTPVEAINGLFGTSEEASTDRPEVPFHPFMLIPGQEVTASYSPNEAAGRPSSGRDMARKEIHLTALNIGKAVVRQKGDSVPDVLQKNVDAIRAVSGVPIVNHPNFVWALTPADLIGRTNVSLLEIWSGHMQSHNLGGGDRPSVEQFWDEVLTAGTLMYGVAADDAHTFQAAPLATAMSVPGRAWIMVRAERFTAGAILEAMQRGDFYASTGVELAEYDVTDRAVSLTIAPLSRSRYRVQFIGKGGTVLRDVAVVPTFPNLAPGAPLRPQVEPVRYEWTGDEGYVRAKVVDSNGFTAWTQPVMISTARRGR